jgi:hypothetical protein
VYQQQQQEQEQEQEQQQDAENPFLDPPFSRIKISKAVHATLLLFMHTFGRNKK